MNLSRKNKKSKGRYFYVHYIVLNLLDIHFNSPISGNESYYLGSR